MLTHRCFFLESPAYNKPRTLAYAEPAFCVWELEVIDFERRAWVKHVLANPKGPDLPAFLAATHLIDY